METKPDALAMEDFVLCRRSRHILPKLLIEPALETWLQATWQADQIEVYGEVESEEYDTDTFLGTALGKLSEQAMELPQLLGATRDGVVTFDADGLARTAWLWRHGVVGLVAYRNVDMWGTSYTNVVAVAPNARMSDAALAAALRLRLDANHASTVFQERTGLIDAAIKRLTFRTLRRERRRLFTESKELPTNG